MHRFPCLSSLSSSLRTSYAAPLGARSVAVTALAFSVALAACSSPAARGNTTPTLDGGDDTGSDGAGPGTPDGGGPDNGPVITVDANGFGDGFSEASPTTSISAIYASTDTELYVMDPKTKTVTLVGKFGGDITGSVTDVAVNGPGDVFVNTASDLYKVTLPAGGTGAVLGTHVSTIATTGQKFYALGFTPSGVLEPGIESLVAGDGNGHLWLIPGATTSTSPTLVDLGDFGAYNAATDPTPPALKSGDTPTNWGLSGDVVFWTDAAGTVHGVATLRLGVTYTTSGGTKNTFVNGDDVLAEIDIAALQSKSGTANLRKGFYGTGSGFGRVFGAGAWETEVFGFTLAVAAKGSSPAIPAMLISIDSTGAGTKLQEFPSISGGWSGAGVSTKATITVPPVVIH